MTYFITITIINISIIIAIRDIMVKNNPLKFFEEIYGHSNSLCKSSLSVNLQFK